MDDTHTQKLILTVESLQNLLVAVATGGAYDESAYRELRQKVVQEPIISRYIPRFINTCRDLGQFWQYIKNKFKTYQDRRDYLWGQFHPLLTFLEKGGTDPSSISVTDILEKIDAPHISEAWRNAYNRRIDDPQGAITSSRTLLESVCKHILDEAGVVYEDKWDLPKLYKKASGHLNLSPHQHQEQVFKQILSGCHMVVSGLGELRNKLGDAHGKGKGFVKPSERHAALAVNLSGTVATFLMNTLEERGICTVDR